MTEFNGLSERHGDTSGDPGLYDVKGHYNRLARNIIELHQMKVISPTAYRKAKKKIDMWYNMDKHRQIDTKD